MTRPLSSRNDYINHRSPRGRAGGAGCGLPAAGQPNLFEELAEEGLRAHKTRKVYVSTAQNPDLYVSIDETIDLKMEALRKHASQFNGWDPEENVRKWAAERAKGKEMEYCETFRVFTLETDEKWAKLKAEQAGISSNGR